MSQSGSRYTRSFAGLVGALVITLLAIAAYVGFRALVRDELVVSPEPIEWGSAVRYAQENDFPVAYPAALPEGWIARHVDVGLGARPLWALSMLTEEQKYVGIRQETTSIDQIVANVVDEQAEQGEPVTLEGAVVEEWTTFTDAGGDYALVAELDGTGLDGVGEGQVLIVFGTADEQQIHDLATALTLDPR